MKRHTKFGIVAVVAAAITGATLSAPAWAAAPEGERDRATSDRAIPVDDPRLNPIPTYFRPGELGEGGLDLATARYLGQVGEASYWLAPDRAGQVCLVAGFRGTDWYAAATCASPEVADKYGLALQIGAGDRAAEAYFATSDHEGLPRPLTQQAPGFYVLDPRTSEHDRATLNATVEGISIVETPISLEGLE